MLASGKSFFFCCFLQLHLDCRNTNLLFQSKVKMDDGVVKEWRRKGAGDNEKRKRGQREVRAGGGGSRRERAGGSSLTTPVDPHFKPGSAPRRQLQGIR